MARPLTLQEKQTFAQKAEARAVHLGQRWTPARASIYQCLLDQTAPVTAYALIATLSDQQGREIKPPTVYRALEALSGMDLIVRIESANAYMACRHLDDSHDHIFLMCDTCGAANEMSDQGVGRKLSESAHVRGFELKRPILELHGICSACQK